MRRISLLIILFVFAFSASPTYAYLDKAHRNTAEETVRIGKESDRYDSYTELYYAPYANEMAQGAVDEDYGSIGGNHRTFRHFYDPDASAPNKGLLYYSWYELWEIKDSVLNLAWESFGVYYERYKNIEVTKPASGYYEDALEWARNSAGARDFNNWEGAIRGYDYTESSRKVAYRRLGHVLHLLADMAQPDHVLCYPHPGSERAIQDPLLNAPIFYGFEQLMEQEKYQLNPLKIKRQKNLDEYFNLMARKAKSELKKSGLRVPLGLNEYVDEILGIGIIKIAWRPTINSDDRTQTLKYVFLGSALLSYATEFGAGLMQDFYDIVNPPPYLKKIVITQEGEAVLDEGWKDLISDVITEGQEPQDSYYRLSSRTPEPKKFGTLKSDKEATILLEFGASGVESPEKIDPGSVEANVGEVKVRGWNKKDDRTFEAKFIPKLGKGEVEKSFTIKVRAKDLDNHYPRQGLPTEGYELDFNPYTPARVKYFEPAYNYEWDGYSPGADENHFITIRNETPPPIVESISVAAGDTYYLNERWMVKDGTHEAELVQEEPIDTGGVNVVEVTTGILRITFSREIDDATLDVGFGAKKIPMKKIAEKTYEGLIRFSEFQDKYLNENYAFSISAQDKDATVLDGDPSTVTYIDEELREWKNYDKIEDLTHRLHIYYEAGGRPIIRGRIRLQKAEGELTMDMQRVFTHGKIYIPGGYMPIEIGLEPAGSGYNVLWYIQYIEIPDRQLFDTYKKLMHTRLAITSRPQIGSTKIISRAEFKDCLELAALRDKIKQSVVCKSGSKPGWMTTTDKDGFFDIPVEKYPGEDGVLYLVIGVKGIPPLGVPATYMPLEVMSFSSMEYYLGSPGLNIIPEQEVPPDLLKEAPDPEKIAELWDRTPAVMKEIQAAQEELAKTESRLKLPEHIEKKWEERAVKDQRALEAEYIKKYGPATGWSEEVRKEFEMALYETPKKSRETWEKDFKAFMAERKKAIDGLQEKLETLRQESKKAQEEIERLLKAKTVWEAKLKEAVGDLALTMMRFENSKLGFIYELAGTVSGSQMTVETREGCGTEVFLIKQTLDEKWRDKPIIGRYIGTGEVSVLANLLDPDSPKPPFVFTFDQPLGLHLVINQFVCGGSSPHVVNVRQVTTTYEPVGKPEIFKSIIDRIWDSLDIELPGNIEVEGFPIEDKALLGELDAALAQYKELNRKVWKDVGDVAKARLAGRIGREEATKKQNGILLDFAKKIEDIAEILKKVKAANPAFSPAVQEKILGRRMPTVQRTVERRPLPLPLPQQMTAPKQPVPPKQMMPPMQVPPMKTMDSQVNQFKQEIKKLQERKKLLIEERDNIASNQSKDAMSIARAVENMNHQIKMVDSQIEMMNKMIESMQKNGAR